MIQIRTFVAPDEPETCGKFIEGHRKLLEIFGITKITSNRQDWVDDEKTIVIVVEDSETKNVYGGARLQIVSGKYKLPIEIALGRYDEGIFTMVNNDHLNGGTCELCGLWNSREIAGFGVGSYILARVGAVVAAQLPVQSIFVLCAPITVKMGRRVGAVVEATLGNQGLFYYPKDDLVATAMRLRNIYDLSTADEHEREKILALREEPYQIMEEKGPKGSLMVSYNLKVPNLR
ncbi:hypothetical protein GCM10023231_03050 [Olivibacter ginsenosidimutans]|uniref:N-acetyltransferase n=1 Tax=Olivibacter ginsenosidimutans TaxID=1176537 RepID=A0ABP9ADI9_9SPHI